MIAETLQCSECCNRSSSGLFECDVGRFVNDVLADTYVFGEGPAPPTEDFIPWFEVCNVLADSFDNPGKIGSQANVFGFEEPVTNPCKE